MGVVFLSFKMGFRPEKILFTSLMGHVVRLPYLFFCGVKTNIGTTGPRLFSSGPRREKHTQS